MYFVSVLIACRNNVSSLSYAALMRANEPETVIIVLILTVCSSIFLLVNITYHGSSSAPVVCSPILIGENIQWGRDWVWVIHNYIYGCSRRRTFSPSSDGEIRFTVVHSICQES